jgi:hypothetical protein
MRLTGILCAMNYPKFPRIFSQTLGNYDKFTVFWENCEKNMTTLDIIQVIVDMAVIPAKAGIQKHITVRSTSNIWQKPYVDARFPPSRE